MKLKSLFALALLLVSTPLYSGSKEFRADTQKITGSGSMWVDYQFGRPGIYSQYFNDFHAPVASYSDFDTNEITGGGTATVVITDAALGILLLTQNTPEDSSFNMQLPGESFIPTVSRNVFCEARLRLGEATQQDILFGLVVRDTTPLAHTDGIVFQKDDGDTNWDFNVTSSSSLSTETAIATANTTDFIKLGFKVIGRSVVEYWINDSKEGEFTTNIPTTELTLTFISQNGSAGAKTGTSLDYLYCAQET